MKTTTIFSDDEQEKPDISFQGWERYPTNVSTFNALIEDGEAYIERLEAMRKELFSSDDALQVIDACPETQFRANSIRLEGSRAVTECLAGPTPALRVVSISRKHSLSPFKITKESLCKTLTRYGVRACFLDLLFGFRASDELSEKGYGLRCADVYANGQCELVYQIRYMERNEHKQGTKWSERQIGVYHRFSMAQTEPALMILLHAKHGSRVQKRLENAFEAGAYREDTAASPMGLHVLILSTYMEEWRWYMDSLGKQCLEMENETFTAELESVSDRSINFRALQVLRNMEAKLLMMTTVMMATTHTIEELRRVCQSISSSSRQIRSTHLVVEECDSTTEERALASLLHKCRAYRDNVEVMQNRVSKLIDLLADGLKEKSQGLTAGISNALLDLTRRSVSDNATVRIVTIITLIYLPTQFVASFFGTNFIVYQQGLRTIQVAKDTWIFVAFAVPLTLLTLSIWFIATRREKKAKEMAAQLDEKAIAFEEP